MSDDDLRVLERWRASFSPALNATAMGLRSAVDALGFDLGVAVTGRSEKRPAIAAKLLLKPSMRLPQVEDVAGVASSCRRRTRSTCWRSTWKEGLDR